MEAIVAISLVALVILSHARAQILNLETYNRNRRNALAMQVAVDLMEQYSAKKLDDLSGSSNFTGTNYLFNGVRFTRALSITKGSDASVYISVTVTPTNSGHSGSATLTKTLALPNSR